MRTFFERSKNYIEEVNKRIESYKLEIATEQESLLSNNQALLSSSELLDKFRSNIAAANQKIGEISAKIELLRKENMKLMSIPKPEAGVNELLLQSQIDEIKKAFEALVEHFVDRCVVMRTGFSIMLLEARPSTGFN